MKVCKRISESKLSLALDRLLRLYANRLYFKTSKIPNFNLIFCRFSTGHDKLRALFNRGNQRIKNPKPAGVPNVYTSTMTRHT